MRKYIILLSFILTWCSLWAQEVEYGLSYKAGNVAKEQRTSLDLTPKDIAVGDSLILKFQYTTQLNHPRFGYLVRMVFDESSNIDLLFSDITTEPALSLVQNGVMLHKYEILRSAASPIVWNDVKIAILPAEELLRVDINGHQAYYTLDIAKQSKAKIIFGTNAMASYATTDVPPVTIKDIGLTLSSGKRYLWPMKNHKGDKVRDLNHGKELKIVNPSWLMDEHARWEHLLNYKSEGVISPVFDQCETIYAISAENLITYNINSRSRKSLKFQEPIECMHINNQFVYDSLNQCIRFIDIFNGSHFLSTLDLTKVSWTPAIKVNNNAYYHQSNIFVSPIDNSINQLFGYGFFRYNSSAFTITNNTLAQSSLVDGISPRHLASMGVAGEQLYLYGGIGNEQGRQELGINVYNDLYCINLRSGEVQKLWEQNSDATSEIAARTLVASPNDPDKLISLFYKPLSDNNELLLKELSLSDAVVTTLMQETLPYSFSDIASQAYLYYSPSLSKLFAVVIFKNEENLFEMNLYSVKYPILPLEEQSTAEQSSSSLLIVAVAIAVLLLLLYMVVRRRRKMGIGSQEVERVELDDKGYELTQLVTPRVRKRGIYLLDGFCVIDKENNDITGEFTPLMKQLLALIILYTHKNNKGVSNVVLKDDLWFDKTDFSARNNRSVIISKLRQALLRVGNFKLTYNNSYWFIEYGEGDFCDYATAFALIKSLASSSAEQRVEQLNEVASYGELLPNMMFDFFDQFKADYTNMVIDALNAELRASSDFNTKISLANLILRFDKIDENATRQKCLVLMSLGKNGVAKTTFDSFAKEYSTLFGAEYELSFEEFIKVE